MAKELQPGIWACEHEGCDFKTTKKGWAEQHEKNKHGGNGGRKEKPKETKGNGYAVCPDCKGNSIRLLNSNRQPEARAKAEGYKYICEKCGEVF